ncbi:MAG TPA: hypothetical protein PKK00_12545 [Bacteroidales bacterium]|nr:hypothetical protein [Bacteroidales bacterium]HPS18057.1 hypothetical protein [Bacteroidales bacterium]
MRYFIGIILGILIVIIGYSTNKTSCNEQVVHNIDKWHTSISISNRYSLSVKDAYAVVKDSLMKKNAFIYILNKKFYKQDNFKNIISIHSKNIYSAAGHGSYYEGDSIVRWEKYYNKKNILIHELFVNYVSYKSKVPNDSTTTNGFVPIWTVVKRDTLGPLYYVQIPDKYSVEMGDAYAFNICGDSTITNDILDDFEIK